MKSQAQVNGQIRAIEGKLINTIDEDEERTINIMSPVKTRTLTTIIPNNCI